MDGQVSRGAYVSIGQLLEDDGRISTAQACAADILGHIHARKAHLGRCSECVHREEVLLVPLCCMRQQLPGRKVLGHLLELYLWMAGALSSSGGGITGQVMQTRCTTQWSLLGYSTHHPNSKSVFELLADSSRR